MKKYRRLDWSDRLRIEALYNAGNTCNLIAKHLGFAPSTIYREIKHGLYEHMGAECTKRPYHYSAQIAQDYADYQSTAKGVGISSVHGILTHRMSPTRYGLACPLIPS